jgi:hypothetical protein
MKVNIHHEGKEGFVKYNKGNHEVMVTHPDEQVRNSVRDYLNTERTFIVNGEDHENVVGNRVPMRMLPTADKHAMTMALCEMFHNTGVHVNWGHEDNDIKDITAVDEPDPNAGADKPIVKSLFDDEDYEIIN